MARDFVASFRSAARASAMALALGAVSLAGCGIKGPLKPPPPAATQTSEPPAVPAPIPPERKP